MKNRFSSFGTHALRTLCIMALCGTTWACKDEYTLDDEKPEWLSENIYSILENEGFSNYLKLLDDPAINTEGARNLKEVLGKTGSNTVFAANDAAWEQFYKRNATLPATNPWHTATSYANLSPAQKNLLVHTSLLENAITMENLSASEASGSNAPEPGQYMRRYTTVSVLDSITYLPADQVPVTYNEEDIANGYDFWEEFRKDNKGIYLVADDSKNMMIHFTREHMGRGDISITDDDFETIMGESRVADDVHIYDARIIEKDRVAENGYVNITDKVPVPLGSMAEVLRTNGKTNIFSHMIDRFSAPFPNTAITEAYKNLHPDFSGTIYTKRYFSLTNASGATLNKGPNNRVLPDGAILYLDPAWSEFTMSSGNERKDMAAMFVPNDEALVKYFSIGGSGSQLVEEYSHDQTAKTFELDDLETLYRNIDCIPLNTLASLLNVIMFNSFVQSVPSKMLTLRDHDSQIEMFEEADRDEIESSLLACNGVIYLMNKVYGPARYESVAGPANIRRTNKIMQWAINNGSDPNADKMHMNYYAYLMAMRSRFSFFLPSDEALKRYYDPISFTSQHPRVIRIEMTDNGRGNPPLKVGKILYSYDRVNGTIAEVPFNLDQLTEVELLNRLRDILESHTIVHTGDNPIDNEDEYYLAKNGVGIKVTKVFNPSTGKYAVTKVQGGFQLENERDGYAATPEALGTLGINIEEKNALEKLNGHTFTIDDSPIIPASRSIYYIMSNEYAAECEKFFELTDMDGNSDITKDCGLKPENLAIWDQGGAVDRNVKFLSNYNFTVLVPSNDAITQAEANGLPTWQDIRDAYNAGIQWEDVDPMDPTAEPEPKRYPNGKVMWIHQIDPQTGEPEAESSDSLKVTTMVTYLNNFIRSHFLDNSFFEDKTARDAKEFTTSSYDQVNGVFIKAYMGRTKSGDGSKLIIHDNAGGPTEDHTTCSCGTHTTTGDLRNIMTRDMTCIYDKNGTMSGEKTTPTGKLEMNYIVLQSSSSAVVHQIDGVINHKPLTSGRFDGDWANVKACKNYLKRFSIPSPTSIKKMKRHE